MTQRRMSSCNMQNRVAEACIGRSAEAVQEDSPCQRRGQLHSSVVLSCADDLCRVALNDGLYALPEVGGRFTGCGLVVHGSYCPNEAYGLPPRPAKVLKDERQNT